MVVIIEWLISFFVDGKLMYVDISSFPLLATNLLRPTKNTTLLFFEQ